MANWLLKASKDWLEPFYEEMKLKLLKHNVLHIDETTVQVLKEPGKAAQSKVTCGFTGPAERQETRSYFMTTSLIEGTSARGNF